MTINDARAVDAAIVAGLNEYRRVALEPSSSALTLKVREALDIAGFKIVRKPRRRQFKNWRRP